MSAENYYFSGQGRVLLASRDNAGGPTGFREVGNVSELSIGIETQQTSHKESQTGLRTVDFQLTTEVSASLEATFESFDRRNLALALWGSESEVEAGAVVDEAHTAALGAIIALDNLQVSNVVVTSEAGATTYVAGTDYEIFNAEAGSIKILDEGSVPEGESILVSYDYDTYETVDAMTLSAQPVRWLRFEGLNTAREGKPVVVDVFKAGVQPLSGLTLINDEVATFPVTMSLLRDGLRTSGSKFFRQRMIL